MGGALEGGGAREEGRRGQGGALRLGGALEAGRGPQGGGTEPREPGGAPG